MIALTKQCTCHINAILNTSHTHTHTHTHTRTHAHTLARWPYFLAWSLLPLWLSWEACNIHLVCSASLTPVWKQAPDLVVINLFQAALRNCRCAWTADTGSVEAKSSPGGVSQMNWPKVGPWSWRLGLLSTSPLHRHHRTQDPLPKKNIKRRPQTRLYFTLHTGWTAPAGTLLYLSRSSISQLIWLSFCDNPKF